MSLPPIRPGNRGALWVMYYSHLIQMGHTKAAPPAYEWAGSDFCDIADKSGFLGDKVDLVRKRPSYGWAFELRLSARRGLRLDLALRLFHNTLVIDYGVQGQTATILAYVSAGERYFVSRFLRTPHHFPRQDTVLEMADLIKGGVDLCGTTGPLT